MRALKWDSMLKAISIQIQREEKRADIDLDLRKSSFCISTARVMSLGDERISIRYEEVHSATHAYRLSLGEP